MKSRRFNLASAGLHIKLEDLQLFVDGFRCLENAKHNSADKGECNIRGNNAQPVHERTGENHGKAPLVYVAASPNA
jgi:hypothetical protein